MKPMVLLPLLLFVFVLIAKKCRFIAIVIVFNVVAIVICKTSIIRIERSSLSLTSDFFFFHTLYCYYSYIIINSYHHQYDRRLSFHCYQSYYYYRDCYHYLYHNSNNNSNGNNYIKDNNRNDNETTILSGNVKHNRRTTLRSKGSVICTGGCGFLSLCKWRSLSVYHLSSRGKIQTLGNIVTGPESELWFFRCQSLSVIMF